jgi:hypothetical protein
LCMWPALICNIWSHLTCFAAQPSLCTSHLCVIPDAVCRVDISDSYLERTMTGPPYCHPNVNFIRVAVLFS